MQITPFWDVAQMTIKKKNEERWKYFPWAPRTTSYLWNSGSMPDFTFEVRNGRMWSWFNLRIYSPPCQGMTGALYEEEKRGKYKSEFSLGKVVSFAWSEEMKQTIRVGREWKSAGSVTYLERLGLVFVLLLSEASKQCRAGGFQESEEEEHLLLSVSSNKYNSHMITLGWRVKKKKINTKTATCFERKQGNKCAQ